MTAGKGKGRAKGKAAELEVVRLLNGWDLMWSARRTGVAGQIEGDIANDLDWYLEVKNRDRLDFWGTCAHTDQMAAALDRPGAVIFRRASATAGERAPWRVILPFNRETVYMMRLTTAMRAVEDSAAKAEAAMRVIAEYLAEEES